MILNLIKYLTFLLLNVIYILFLHPTSQTVIRRLIKLLIIVFFFFFAYKISYSQDTICVTRKEMIHFATNSINLKSCTSENLLLKEKIETCENIKTQLQFSNESKSQLLKDKESEIEKLSIDIKKEISKKHNWKIVSLTSIGITTFLLILNQF